MSENSGNNLFDNDNKIVFYGVVCTISIFAVTILSLIFHNIN